MKYLNGEYYVEVKDKRYIIHLTKKIILRERDPPISLRIHYQVQNETQIRKNQRVIKINNEKLVVRNYPKNRQPIYQPEFELANCPSCRMKNWFEFDKGYYCQICEFIINKQKLRIDKKSS